jgi:hypothetical protein
MNATESQPGAINAKPRWRRFLVGTMCLFVLFAGIGIIWGGLKIKQCMEDTATRAKEEDARAKRKQELEPIRKLGGTVYDGCSTVHGGVYVAFDSDRVNDATLERLKGLPPIDGLDFSGCHITDAGLAHLKGMPQLIVLELDDTKVTNAGLADVKGLAKLESLSLNNTAVTDAGLDNLKGLTQLRWLDLDGTGVTDEGVKRLQIALPNCHIQK